MPSGIPRNSKFPQTSKDIDMVVFRRVSKRLINDKVSLQDFERYVDQARMLLEESIADARYEKQYLSHSNAKVIKKHREPLLDPLTELMMEQYGPVLEALSKT